MIAADGQGQDWPEIPPQYYDQETRTSIRVMNDETALYLYATIGNQEITHELMQAGFSLSLDFQEAGAIPFAIKVNGQMPAGRPGKPEASGSNSRSGPAGSSPASGQGRPGQDMNPGSIKQPETLVVTYPYSSGPMTMTRSEARDKGIELGLGNLENGTVIIEAVVRLAALVSDEKIVPGNRVMLTLSCSEKRASGKGSEPSDKGKPDGAGPPGGGGMGQKQGGGPEKTTQAFQAQMALLLVPGPDK
jgi:hypothetical protein